MVLETISGNGHNPDSDLDMMNRAREVAEGHQHEDGISGNLSLANLSLLQKMLTAPEEFRENQVFLICEFMDEDEAYDNVAAFFEARDLGMDTNFNVAYMFALAASNRKTKKNNRVAALLDALQHVKYTSNTPSKEGKDGNKTHGPIG